MEFNQSLFSISPKTFKTVNADFPSIKSFSMVNCQMPVTTKHQRIIASKFIGVNERTSPNGFDRVGKQFTSADVLDDCDLYKAFSLENTEYRRLILGSSSAFTFSLAAEIRLISRDLSLEQEVAILALGSYGLANE